MVTEWQVKYVYLPSYVGMYLPNSSSRLSNTLFWINSYFTKSLVCVQCSNKLSYDTF